jgi:hypothetical protein
MQNNKYFPGAKFTWNYKTAGKFLAVLVLLQSFYWITDIPFSIGHSYTISAPQAVVSFLFYYLPVISLSIFILRFKDEAKNIP